MEKNYLSFFSTKQPNLVDSFWGKSNIYEIYKKINFITLDDDVCSICQTRKKIKTKGDNCNHSFCFNCILCWVRINNICPLCKRRIMKLERC